ncbi:hypothetical protein OFO01_07290 [Campylobacter sp. JMF_01 NE2]|uniref:hypothetical protein n=1 Tax=unclassified Campylobacter TaxID=2593542 RepID=UPI0022EA0747|nr:MULTISPECIES: hypothetical protein [unclassified Campylobacter]MDA3053232.1 hypothetical protein [Campylobacter sp. JMF_03 NE3]MDA3067585.1 hypothetical protein [Campylobacter sp. JMF_01 NE2]
MITYNNNNECYVVELEEKPVLDFEFSVDSYFRIDFEEKVEFIPIMAVFVSNDTEGHKEITGSLVKVEYMPKNSSRSFGKYRCKYEQF